MRSTTLRLGVAILTFVAGLTVSRLFSAQPRIETPSQAEPVSCPQMDRRDGKVLVPDCRGTDRRIDSALASEITFATTGGMIIDSSPTIVLRRGASKRFGDASVTATYSDTKEGLRGKLAARYYNNLLTVIEAQGYFCMRNEYTMGVTDSPIILTDVTVGDRRKVIKATIEAVPIQLRSIYEAIETTREKVRWSRAAVKLRTTESSAKLN